MISETCSAEQDTPPDEARCAVLSVASTHVTGLLELVCND